MVVVDAAVVVGSGDKAWSQAIVSMDALVCGQALRFKSLRRIKPCVGKSDLCLLNVLRPGLSRRQVLPGDVSSKYNVHLDSL